MSALNVEEIVKKVISELNNENSLKECEYGIFESMNDAIEASFIAQRKYLKHSLSDRDKYIKAIKNEFYKEENLKKICKMTVEETGMGNYSHKLLKNRLVLEKTPGVEDLKTDAYTGDKGLTLVELSPYGVIGSITPTTNPTETILCNTIGMLAAGNSIVFSPHPRAKEVSLFTIKLINKALKEAKAPDNLVVTVKNPTIENANIMMKHEKVKLLVATGGPGVVKSVLSTGKKAIGAGAGNPPAVVDETADIEKAAKDIVDGCSFDNNLPCIAEKEVIAVDEITDYLIFNMKKNGAYEIKDKETLNNLQNLVLSKDLKLNTECVGKSARYLLDKIGIQVEDDIKVIIMETDKNHPFVIEELMMPILPIVRVKDVDEAIELSIEVEHGNRHTAIMHSKNIDKLSKMAKLIQTTIFVKNGPSYSGIGVDGEGYTTFTIAGPTGEGLTSAKTFARKRRCVLVDGFDIR
ncbi:aldehyde dehydrogenase family protein [Romboutsia sp. 1001285H_161024_C4]|uniref:aldehyde dehydrogenase family protein n=1 Tax=Romboutsia sp. 1001285H_161024_C4 TaxID=2787109 RepID=UPI0018998CB1|nr:aldehyde dehydrogenase family protein [Romboutsia sp. 1001285H_161024_C4]